MKMIRGTLKLALILYICAALSGVYVLSASAKITPHEEDAGKTKVIVIKKGDTLWDLCQEHLEDPLRWRELSEYNDFTNPHLIYPGEELFIPWELTKTLEKGLQEEIEAQTVKMQELEEENQALTVEMREIQEEIKAQRVKVQKLQEEIENKDEAIEKIDELQEGFSKSQVEVIAGLKETLEMNRASLEKNVAHLSQLLQGLEKTLAEQNAALKAAQEQREEVLQNIAMLLKVVEMNQQGLKELQMLMEDAKGIHEELSSSKRALVFLTTLAAGVGLFAINAIGGRSGE